MIFRKLSLNLMTLPSGVGRCVGLTFDVTSNYIAESLFDPTSNYIIGSLFELTSNYIIGSLFDLTSNSNPPDPSGVACW